jgi:RNA polymerase sigma-70 factor (ECF subfamily)
VGDPADQRLWQEIRAGRREACAELVRAHYAGVYRFLLHLTRDGGRAEDLTQDTFAAAWEKIGAFEGRSGFRTWLHRIAYHKFVDARRAERYRPATAAPLAEEIAPGPGPLDAAIAGDRARRLYQALDRLDADDRALLVLHYLQGLSYREMADVLGEPAGTVKWRTSLALTRLRDLLPAEGDTHDAEPTARAKKP